MPAQTRLYGRLLSLFLVVIATVAAATLILWNDQIYLGHTIDRYWIPYLLIFALMLKGPALFLYIAAITRPRFTLKPIYLAHLAPGIVRDRKSTRLNSSHVAISYAVFCLKKKTTQV